MLTGIWIGKMIIYLLQIIEGIRWQTLWLTGIKAARLSADGTILHNDPVDGIVQVRKVFRHRHRLLK